MDRTRLAIRKDNEYRSESEACLELTQGQSNEFIKDFAFWPRPSSRTGDNSYDVRTYFLNAGRCSGFVKT